MRPDHLAERAIGNVLSLVLLVLVVVQLVRGESASPYAQLLLVAGVVWAGTYLVAKRRSGRPASSGRPQPRAG